jgi:hypothetical protein
MSEWQNFGVLLQRKRGGVPEPDFEYRGETLPEIGDDIRVTPAHPAAPEVIQARVTGIEVGKSLPIRATEL